MQRVIKALLGYGARIPKELMLFVKNMMFVDGAIATLAPDLDILAGDRARSRCTSPPPTARRIAKHSGMDADAWELDMEGVKAGFGISDDVDRLTYRDLQKRREIIRKRLEGRRLE